MRRFLILGATLAALTTAAQAAPVWVMVVLTPQGPEVVIGDYPFKEDCLATIKIMKGDFPHQTLKCMPRKPHMRNHEEYNIGD